MLPLRQIDHPRPKVYVLTTFEMMTPISENNMEMTSFQAAERSGHSMGRCISRFLERQGWFNHSIFELDSPSLWTGCSTKGLNSSKSKGIFMTDRGRTGEGSFGSTRASVFDVEMLMSRRRVVRQVHGSPTFESLGVVRIALGSATELGAREPPKRAQAYSIASVLS